MHSFSGRQLVNPLLDIYTYIRNVTLMSNIKCCITFFTLTILISEILVLVKGSTLTRNCFKRCYISPCALMALCVHNNSKVQENETLLSSINVLILNWLTGRTFRL